MSSQKNRALMFVNRSEYKTRACVLQDLRPGKGYSASRIDEDLEKGGGRGLLRQSSIPAPQLMVSISDLDIAGTCATCGGHVEDLQHLRWRAGDNVCERCDALFTAAHALLDDNDPNKPVDEAVILGTLAFVWSGSTVTADLEDHDKVELLREVHGVSLVKIPRIAADVIAYAGSSITEAVKLDVFSRDVGPQELAEAYEGILKRREIHFDRCSGGSVTWDVENGSLTLTVHAMRKLDPGRVPFFEAYPAGRIYSFPPPELVSGFYRTLLGSIDKRRFSGYAHALAESGRHTREKAVTAIVAWLLGERKGGTPPRERRPRIARVLNKHLLKPRGEQELPEDYWTPDDTVWRDARQLEPRILRNLYLFQEGRIQQFPQTTV